MGISELNMLNEKSAPFILKNKNLIIKDHEVYVNFGIHLYMIFFEKMK